MMPGDKGHDISSRLKRSGKLGSRSSRGTTSSASASISAPPKAAIAASKPKKEDPHRMKTSFEETISQKFRRDGNNRSSSTPEVEDDQYGATLFLDSNQGSPSNDRNIELERALAAALEEQNALREELDRARQRGNAYREALEDVRRQLSGPRSPRASPLMAPHGEIEKRSEGPSPPSREGVYLVEQNREFQEKLTELQEQLVDYQRHRTRSESDWSELTRRLHRSEKESQARLQQLLDLKQSISSLTRTDSQVTDAELAERMDQLYHRIREWVISNFRRSKLDFESVSQSTADLLDSINPNYTQTTSGERLAFYQAIVTSNIMYLFEERLFIGLPNTPPLSALKQVADYIHDSSSDYQEWRRTTIRALSKSPAKAVVVEGRDKLLHQMSLRIQHQLHSISGISLPSAAQSSLLTILQHAADLQHVLVLQKAEYKVHFFLYPTNETQVAYDSSRMDSVNDDEDADEDMDVDRKFEFCVFPMLEKFGDEAGENMEVINILMKARVCCGVG